MASRSSANSAHQVRTAFSIGVALLVVALMIAMLSSRQKANLNREGQGKRSKRRVCLLRESIRGETPRRGFSGSASASPS